MIEFFLKPKSQWTGVLLACLNTFAVAVGKLYTGTLSCAIESLLGSFGRTDNAPLNDIAPIDASAEVTWSCAGAGL